MQLLYYYYFFFAAFAGGCFTSMAMPLFFL
jgi:hypothetical protein